MVGQRLRSKGGGPTLFVQELVSDEVVLCTWMNAMGKHKTESFLLSGLEDLDPPAAHAQPLGVQFRLGAPVALVALLQIIGLGAYWRTPGL